MSRRCAFVVRSRKDLQELASGKLVVLIKDPAD